MRQAALQAAPRYGLIAAGALVAACAVMLGAGVHAKERPAKSDGSAIAARADGYIELWALRDAKLSAERATRELRRLGRVSPQAAARALAQAEYPPRDIEAAIATQYRLGTRQAARIVRSALREPARIQRNASLARGEPVSICVRPDGGLVQCASGSSPTGGSQRGEPPPPTAANWAGTTLQPGNDALAGTDLIIRPPAGSTLPNVTVQLGGQGLPVQWSPQEVRVSLPGQAVTGPLVMTNTSTGLSGPLASEYRVRAPGLRDWMNTTATSHHWHNSYLLALVSYYIYSDALGTPASSTSDFRSLMQSWGMDDVEFVELPHQHLRAAVAWGDDLVVVVFRGSEMHATAHCVMGMMFPSICAHLSPNWMTNLSFAPMRQRPEWGSDLHLRTHPGFDTAVEQLFPDVISRVKAELTPSRRLFITGHSLGGAMATLFAYRAQQLEEVPVQGVYTYGAPRLMNVPFAAHYQATLGSRTHRWQNRSDPAPGLPPGQPIGSDPIPPLPPLVARETYRHTGRLNYLPSSGVPQLNRTSEPFDLPGSVAELAVADHMMAKSPNAYVNRIHMSLTSTSQGLLPPVPAP